MSQKKKTVIIILSALLLILIGVTAVFASPFIDSYFSDKTVKNVRFANTDIGRMTKAEIKKIVEKEANEPKNVKISVNETVIETDVSVAGVEIDVEKTADKIMKAGKNDVFEAMKIRNKKGGSIQPEFKIDIKLLENSLTEQLSQNGLTFESYVVNIKKDTADFTIRNEVSPVNYDALAKEITDSWFSDEKKTISAKFKEFKWPEAEELRRDFDISPKDAQITIEDGKRKINGHVIGREIDFEALKEKIDIREVNFTVSYKVLNPKVYTDDLGEENFPDLLGKYQTTFSNNGDGRASNIKLAVSKINGYVMNTGDVFSFNRVVGPRTYSAGFRDANVFSANGVEQGVGGGICQVSSTLYIAALYSDLKIVERRNHNYVVAYAPAGLDATVSYGTIDFRFKNNMNNPVKIKAEINGNTVSIRIYGTKEETKTVVLDTKTLSVTPKGEKRVFDPSLPVGREVVEQSGYDGRRVQAYKYVKNSQGAVVRTENLGISNYIILDKTIKYNDGVGEKISEEPKNAEEPVVALPGTEPSVTENIQKEGEGESVESDPVDEVFEEKIPQEQTSLQGESIVTSEQMTE